MKWFVFFAFLLSYFEGNVANNPIDDRLRQVVVGVVDGKQGVHCNDPFTNEQCPGDQVSFWLYTKDRQDNPHQLNPFDDNTIRNAPFVQHQPVKILVHGYTMNKDKAINEVLRPAYFKHFNYNIISIDWSAICPEHCYKQAALSVKAVGVCVTELVHRMDELRKDLGEIHILGHSMGAHVTSWASQKLNLARVTQFDPAMPLFKNKDSDLFVKPKGKYADVWHSNTGVKGRVDPSGTVDIYLNDGMDQPGCDCDASCSHMRAVQYYGETVSDQTRLKAFPCNSFEEFVKGDCPLPTMEALRDFGEQFTPDTTGSYLAFTNRDSPFIINGEDYTRDDKFRSFKESHAESCPVSDVTKGVGEFLI